MNWNQRGYSRDTFKKVWMNSSSIRECAVILGISPNGGSYKSLRLAAKDLGLDESHMDSIRVNRSISSKSIPLDQILVENSTYTSTSNLRKRLIDTGLLVPRCSAPYCPVPTSQIDPWTGDRVEEPKLCLDHINGINTDNRIENLRILCAYCHSHTKTFCGSNRKKFHFCSQCGSNVSGPEVSKCKKCKNNENSKFKDISLTEIIIGVKTYGYLAYGKMIGVSDNGIRKHLRREGIDPLPRKEKV